MNSQSYSPAQPAQQEGAVASKRNAKSKKSPSAFRTISEVADDLNVQQHVLRFWETKFSQVKPLKRGGGRRYYRPEDVALLKSIHHLLYTEGYTIKGVQKLLKEQGKNQLVQNNKPTAVRAQVKSETAGAGAQSVGLSHKNKALLEGMLNDLRDMRALFLVGEQE